MTDQNLDEILAVQFTVSWAGEARCSPSRLGWWETDLIDLAGGGDFLARLLPQTHAWAALEAVREAARRVDAKARAKLGDPDRLRTLFFLGFALDEQLADRLSEHKRGGGPPANALSLPLNLSGDFSPEALARVLKGDDAAFTIVPGGRQLKGARPESAVATVRRLASALLPLVAEYPLPFYRVES